MILGFLSKQKYTQQDVTIEPGDVMVLYTDGITEAAAPALEGEDGDLFEEKRLIKAVQSVRTRSAREIQAAILHAISDHTGNAPQNDDITLVVIKRRSETGETSGCYRE